MHQVRDGPVFAQSRVSVVGRASANQYGSNLGPIGKGDGREPLLKRRASGSVDRFEDSRNNVMRSASSLGVAGRTY